MKTGSRDRRLAEDDELQWPPAGATQSRLMQLEGEGPWRREFGAPGTPASVVPAAPATPPPAVDSGRSWVPAGGLRFGWSGAAAGALLLVVAAEGAVLLLDRPSRDSPPREGQRASTPGTAGPTAELPRSDAGHAVAPATLPPSRLSVQTDPPGATVAVDGEQRGVAPLEITDLPPGEHEVAIDGARGRVRHRVRLEAGQPLSLVVPLGSSSSGGFSSSRAGTGGWVIVASPLELRVLEEGRLLGTSSMERVPLARGSHRLILKNEDAGIEFERSVEVSPGKATTLSVEVPTQRVAVNASPWADVSVDGRRVGETPIGSLRLPVGPHLLVFRHPQFGEQAVRVIVRADEPTRVGVNMTTK
jgi:hypothetical protein